MAAQTYCPCNESVKDLSRALKVIVLSSSSIFNPAALGLVHLFRSVFSSQVLSPDWWSHDGGIILPLGRRTGRTCEVVRPKRVILL